MLTMFFFFFLIQIHALLLSIPNFGTSFGLNKQIKKLPVNLTKEIKYLEAMKMKIGSQSFVNS